MSAFRKSPRMDDGLSKRQFQDVAPISDEMAKLGTSTEISERDLLHQAALDRAKQVKDEELGALASKDAPAKYKIEVKFQKDRTVHGPNTCVVEFWESGSKLHGGGDALMFMCRNKEDYTQGCGAIFSQDYVRGAMALCPKCNRLVNASLLTNSLSRDDKHRLSSRELATFLAKFWMKLGGDADIYLKFHPEDASPKPAYLTRSGALRKKPEYEKAIYSLKRIIEDTASGASLEKCIYNFMTA